MSLKYEPASKPLHIYVKDMCDDRAVGSEVRGGGATDPSLDESVDESHHVVSVRKRRGI